MVNANEALNPSRTCLLFEGSPIPTLKGRSEHAMDWQDKRIHLSVSICQQDHQKHLVMVVSGQSPPNPHRYIR